MEMPEDCDRRKLKKKQPEPPNDSEYEPLGEDRPKKKQKMAARSPIQSAAASSSGSSVGSSSSSSSCTVSMKRLKKAIKKALLAAREISEITPPAQTERAEQALLAVGNVVRDLQGLTRELRTEQRGLNTKLEEATDRSQDMWFKTFKMISNLEERLSKVEGSPESKKTPSGSIAL